MRVSSKYVFFGLLPPAHTPTAGYRTASDAGTCPHGLILMLLGTAVRTPGQCVTRLPRLLPLLLMLVLVLVLMLVLQARRSVIGKLSWCAAYAQRWWRLP